MRPEASQTECLQSTLRDDPDLQVLVEMFVDEMPQRIAAVRRTAEAGDLEALRRLAHQIKGSAGSHGFQPISDYAAHLEDLLRDGSPEDQVHQKVLALLDICARARA